MSAFIIYQGANVMILLYVMLLILYYVLQTVYVYTQVN